MGSGTLYRSFGTAEYARAFISGQIRCCSLAQYRAIENDAARGDRLEGQRLHRPAGGLTLNLKDGTSVQTTLSFSAASSAKDIFVLCTSLALNEAMFERFNATCAVAIRSAGQLKGRMNDALGQRYRGGPWELNSGKVSHYKTEDSPGIDWAPHRSAFCKVSDGYEEQAEMRFAFALNGAFNPGRAKFDLRQAGTLDPVDTDYPAPILLMARPMDRFCSLVER